MGLPAVGCASLLLLSGCWGDERAKMGTPSSAISLRSEAAASRADVGGVLADETLEAPLFTQLGILLLTLTPPYAIFAIESPELGRRRSNAQPRPPAARHSNGMVVAGDGSAPRHAQVWSAIVNGIEYPTTSNARSTL